MVRDFSLDHKVRRRSTVKERAAIAAIAAIERRGAGNNKK
jgi:hypothetical protein